MEWKKYNKPLPAKMKRASREYGLIEEGDKIAVGLSGGKDSTVMLYALSILQRTLPVDFAIQAISLDVGWKNDFAPIAAYCQTLGIPYHLEETDIGRIVYEERQEKSPCSLCAKMRRGALHRLAKDFGCNKIALGHHLNDALETFMMSLTFEGRLHTFAPRSYLSRMDLTLIRPMIYVLEKDIVTIARQLELPVVANNCPADGTTKRADMKSLLEQMEKDNPFLIERMQSAITNGIWQQYLIEPPSALSASETDDRSAQ